LTEIPRITVEAGRWAVARLAPGAAFPEWAASRVFCSVTRTRDELSVVCPEEAVPGGVQSEGGWALVRLEGPFPFTAVGILSSVLAPLAGAGVSIVAVSTFDTDYVLVKQADLGRAVEALDRARGGGGAP
jgi:hypothetical protein